MTVKEFTESYFTLASKIENLHVVQNDGHGKLLNKYSGPLKSTIWMRPEVQRATIGSWWVDTKAKVIRVSLETEE